MKKYILLIIACFISFTHIKANETIQSDTIIFPDFNFEIDSSELAKLKDLGNMDFKDMEVVKEALESARKEMKKAGKDISSAFKNKNYSYSYNYNFNNSKRGNKTVQQRTPTRVENKSFSNISEIEFFQVYGNIVVRESSSNKVDLEIQYFDAGNRKATSNISTSNKLLTISTQDAGGGSSKAKINYIISIPKNVALNIDCKYGDIRMDKYNAAFYLNLSYGNISAQSLKGKTSLKAKYSDLKIDEVQDAEILVSYSDLRLKKAGKIEVKSNYSDCYFEDVHTMTTGKSSSYGDLKIGRIENLEGSMMYADIDIENLLGSINVATSYGDITIKMISSKAKNINIKASYADVLLSLDPSMSATINANLNYGDIKISKKYAVKYTESSETNNRVVKKGQIGNGNPTASIVVSNNYADISIR